MSAVADQSVTLGWEQSSDPATVGYNIYYGVDSHDYTNMITVGNVTNATFFGLVGGVTYYFAATTYDAQNEESGFSSESVYVVPLNPVPAASLAKVVFSGQNVTFSAAGQGTGPLQYQWKFNSMPIDSGTNAVLALTNLTATQAGTYYVTVTDGSGEAQMLAASLTVYTTAAANLTQGAYVNGQYSFYVSGVTNSQYVVQSSTNLVNWVSMQTNLAPFLYSDPTAGFFKQRYYRAFSVINESNSIQSAMTVNSGLAVLNHASYINGQYSFSVTDSSNSQYIIQASPNLVDWVSVETNTAPFVFVDANAAQSRQQFYRALYADTFLRISLTALINPASP